MRTEEVSFLLPTLNEEDSIQDVISEIRKIAPESKILVGDGLSRDKTVQKCNSMGIIPYLVGTRGKGVAIQVLIPKISTPYAIMTDCDLTYPIISATHTVLDKLEKGYDIVIGERVFVKKGAISRLNKIGNIFLTDLANYLYKTHIKDLLTGLIGFNTEALRRLNIESERFQIEAEVFSKTITESYKIYRFPIEYKPRPKGGSKSKVKVIKDGIEIARTLLKYRR